MPHERRKYPPCQLTPLWRDQRCRTKPSASSLPLYLSRAAAASTPLWRQREQARELQEAHDNLALQPRLLSHRPPPSGPRYRNAIHPHALTTPVSSSAYVHARHIHRAGGRAHGAATSGNQARGRIGKVQSLPGRDADDDRSARRREREEGEYREVLVEHADERVELLHLGHHHPGILHSTSWTGAYWRLRHRAASRLLAHTCLAVALRPARVRAASAARHRLATHEQRGHASWADTNPNAQAA